MSIYKANWFKYFKNLIIGVGASLVMLGALGKINSYSWGGIMITVGLVTEAFLFFMLGVLPPEKDYYWEKLYPGLGDINANITPLTAGPSSKPMRPLDADVVENNLGGMLEEMQTMSRSLASLKALQEVDFSKTKDQLKGMNDFYSKMNDAMSTMDETLEDTKQYKESIASLNRNLSSLNSVYGNVLSAFKGGLS